MSERGVFQPPFAKCVAPRSSSPARSSSPLRYSSRLSEDSLRWASQHGLLSFLSPSFQSRKVFILTFIKSTPQEKLDNPSAVHDLYFILSLLEAERNEEANLFVLLTDVQDLSLPCARARVLLVEPSRENIKFSLMFTTATLCVGDDWLAWFGCHGSGNRSIYLKNTSELVYGREILDWITCYANPRVMLRLAFDVCYAGRGLLGLPFYVNSDGEQVASDVSLPLEWTKMASVLCVSACTDTQKAHIVELDDGKKLGGLLWYIPDLLDKDGTGAGCAITEIQRELSPHLSKKGKWVQTPEVSTTLFNAEARFWMGGPRP